MPISMGSRKLQQRADGRLLVQQKQTRAQQRCGSPTLPGALVPSCCLCVGHCSVSSLIGVPLQDPFAVKEVYHDGPFALFMINTFSNRMSSLLGGASSARAGKALKIKLRRSLLLMRAVCNVVRSPAE